MIFKRAIQRYGQTPEPVTPYQKAAQLWDERIGTARVQAKNWRLMAFGCFGLALGLAGGVLWLGAESRITPYVVEVDKLGEVQAIGPAITPYKPDDAQIAFFLARFITDVRSLSLDPIVLRQNWLEAYAYATDHGAAFLNDFARTDDPFKAVGERTVSVQVTSVVRASKDASSASSSSASSFLIKWTEQTYDHGSLSKTERWTAIAWVVLQPPRSVDALRQNPLGLYVNGLNWSRELNPGESP